MGDIKRRSQCDKEKKLSEVIFRKGTQKYRNQCRGCIRLMNKEHRTMKKERIKIRRKEY